MKDDKALRQKMAEIFADFEAEPRQQSWENIRQAIGRRKRRPFIFFLWYLGASLLLGAGVVAGRHDWMWPAAPVVAVPPPTQSRQDRIVNQSAKLPVSDPARTILSGPSFTPNPRVSPISRNDKRDPDLIQETLSIPQSVPIPLIPLLPTLEPGLLSVSNSLQPPTAIPATDSPIPAPKRKTSFFAGASALAVWQSMAATAPGRLAGIGKIPVADARRLGFLASAGMCYPIGRHSELIASLQFADLPQWEQYQVNNNRYSVERNQNTGGNIVTPLGESYAGLQHLRSLGIVLDYGRSVEIQGVPVAFFAGGEIAFERGMQKVWSNAGLDIPFGGAFKRFHLVPEFRYRFDRDVDPNRLLRIGVYGIGVGVRWNPV